MVDYKMRYKIKNLLGLKRSYIYRTTQDGLIVGVPVNMVMGKWYVITDGVITEDKTDNNENRLKEYNDWEFVKNDIPFPNPRHKPYWVLSDSYGKTY